MSQPTGPRLTASLPFTPVLVQPLPITVTPFPNETLNSYFSRLASANRTTTTFLRSPSRWLRCRLNELELLEILTSQPRTSLVWAIPELRKYDPQIAPRLRVELANTRFACRCCVWRAGGRKEVHVYLRAPYDNVCLHHGIWLKDGVAVIDQQIDLTPVPEVVHAQRVVNRLEKKYGELLVADCYEWCHGFFGDLDRRALVRAEADELLNRLCEANHMDPPRHAVPVHSDRHYRFRRASRYPQIAKLMTLAFSPALRGLTRSSPDQARERIPAEFERLIPLDYQPRSTTGPWLRDALVNLVKRIDTFAKLLRNAEAVDLDPSHAA
ncbi:TniQ family protein [Kitasatospora sp. RG8]|uniref:TniQ family protein n=1 Tax=Kitasatospora sp. RG8 TaxID=2820815 RepID=UPI001ADF4DDE|nr:TniQ family protein [Kitasatospora sp. RG8]MBP0452098.1 TniQ family protein [Kitasatospora sp. RG8]